MSISVLILTLNEETNIAACLDSVSWSNDVVVLDSGSDDRTVEIARARGARVFRREFDDYALQRNYGLREISYRNPWVLLLDADERVPSDLRQEMLSAVHTAPEDVAVFMVRGKNYLHGRWIPGSSGYPTWFERLVRPQRVWFERSFNEQLRTDGSKLSLRGHLNHYPFNKGYAAWIAKHNRYSSMEAQLMVLEKPRNWCLRDLLSSDPPMRRRAAKGLVYSLPARPILVFLYLYLLRGGVFEGRAGLTYTLLRTGYEFAIDCKRRELKRRGRGLPI